MGSNEFNKEEIKRKIKEKIKERITRELIEEIYQELNFEKNELIEEITSVLDLELVPSMPSKSFKEPYKTNKNAKRPKISIEIKPILKIASHAIKYANPKIPKEEWVEVIGLLAGKEDKNKDILFIKDAYPMGHGSALHAEIKDYKNYERAYQDIRKNNLFICGWYHSHPSYGTFMSQEDLTTQERYQKLWNKSVALVIDPTKINGRSHGFKIFKTGVASNTWEEIPHEIKGNLSPALLSELIEFINPIVDGKAIYLEYDEE